MVLNAEGPHGEPEAKEIARCVVGDRVHLPRGRAAQGDGEADATGDDELHRSAPGEPAREDEVEGLTRMNRKQEVACWIIGLAVAYAMMNGGHIEVPFLFEEWMPTAGVALVGALAVYSLRSRRTDTGL